MTAQRAGQVHAATPAAATSEAQKTEFPVREYIGAMAVELAQMARWDGDETLAQMLDAAAVRAGETLARQPLQTAEPAHRLPS